MRLAGCASGVLIRGSYTGVCGSVPFAAFGIFDIFCLTPGTVETRDIFSSVCTVRSVPGVRKRPHAANVAKLELAPKFAAFPAFGGRG